MAIIYEKKPSEILDEKDRAMALSTDFLFDMRRQLQTAGFGERHISQFALTGEKWQEFYKKANEKMAADHYSDSSMIFLGARGTGKTQLACELARNNYFGFMKTEYNRIVNIHDTLQSKTIKYAQVCKKNHVRYTTWFKLWQGYINAVTSSDDNLSGEYLSEIEKVPLLVIDELHRLKTDSIKELTMLESILDARYQNNKSTIVISNFDTIEELYDLVGQTIAHRMQESYQVLDFANIKSYR